MNFNLAYSLSKTICKLKMQNYKEKSLKKR
jgi:hypothetical protein